MEAHEGGQRVLRVAVLSSTLVTVAAAMTAAVELRSWAWPFAFAPIPIVVGWLALRGVPWARQSYLSATWSGGLLFAIGSGATKLSAPEPSATFLFLCFVWIAAGLFVSHSVDARSLLLFGAYPPSAGKVAPGRHEPEPAPGRSIAAAVAHAIGVVSYWALVFHRADVGVTIVPSRYGMGPLELGLLLAVSGCVAAGFVWRGSVYARGFLLAASGCFALDLANGIRRAFAASGAEALLAPTSVAALAIAVVSLGSALVLAQDTVPRDALESEGRVQAAFGAFVGLCAALILGRPALPACASAMGSDATIQPAGSPAAGPRCELLAPATCAKVSGCRRTSY